MRTLLIAVAVCCTAAAASAQPGIGFEVERKEKAKLEPPTLNARADDTGQTWVMIGAVLFVLMAVGANLIPSKRGHQD
ncbi:MAG: hypothetical protein KIT68_11450 [Phycisphaeraceae bacterium]|nr:hypothetical protein [Phycisphaeraceae bacterium]